MSIEIKALGISIKYDISTQSQGQTKYFLMKPTHIKIKKGASFVKIKSTGNTTLPLPLGVTSLHVTIPNLHDINLAIKGTHPHVTFIGVSRHYYFYRGNPPTTLKGQAPVGRFAAWCTAVISHAKKRYNYIS